MDTLPPELLELIVDQCEHSALKCLRSVNYTLHDASTPRLFEHFFMGFFEDCLDNLVSLSQSPLAKHVKRFTFYTDILPDWDRERWELNLSDTSTDKAEKYLRAHPKSCPVDVAVRLNDDLISRNFFTAQELNCRWRDFCRLRSEQRAWREDVHGLVFKEYFAMLPNLSEVTCVPACLLRRLPKSWPVWNRLRKRMLCRPADWSYETVDSPQDDENDFITTDDMSKIPRARLCGRATLCVLGGISFRASFSGTKHVAKLTVHHLHDTPWRWLFGRLAETIPNPQYLDHVARYNEVLGECFCHLIEIHLRVPIALESDPSAKESAASAAEIEDLLHCAKQLKSLTLTDNDDDTGLMIQALSEDHPLETLFKSKSVWPQLKHLTLSVDIGHSSMLCFFESLASTLRSLHLCDMVVADDRTELRDLISRIPKILKLRSVYVNSLWYRDWHPGTHDDDDAFKRFYCMFCGGTNIAQPFEQAVKAYLLGQSQELPDLTLGEVSLEDRNNMGMGTRSVKVID